jgi:hypothetical protein
VDDFVTIVENMGRQNDKGEVSHIPHDEFIGEAKAARSDYSKMWAALNESKNRILAATDEMEIAEKEFTFRAHDGGTTLFV